MAITSTQLVNYAKGQLGRMYVYGCYGQIGSEQIFKEKQAQYPARINKWPKYTYVEGYGQKWHDCAGLIKGAAWCNGEIDGKPKYDSKTDRSSDGLIQCCIQTGNADTVPEVPGLIMWKPGHVGVYCGNGVTCEAKGHMYGVVLTTATAWKMWGKLPPEYCTYNEEPGRDTCMVELDVLRKGCKDTNGQRAVKSLQTLLNAYGYKDQNGDSLVIDGSFGSKTDYAVKQFQKAVYPACGDVDGVVGTKTWNKLIDG